MNDITTALDQRETTRPGVGPTGAGATHRDPRARSPLVRAGAVALLVAAPLNLVVHVLWRIGHGPTVVNEHGVVLGLTNDEWSYLGTAWQALLAFGVVAACSLHRGRLRTFAGTLTVAGIAITVAAKWIWPLYALGTLAQAAGTAALAVMVLRGRVLSRWAGVALLVAVVSFLPLPVAPDAVFATLPFAFGTGVEYQDVIALCDAAGWVALGLALRGSLRRTPTAPGPASGHVPVDEGVSSPRSR